MISSSIEPGVVQVSQTGNGRFQVEVQAAGTRFFADEPVESGGLGSGPTPYELLASALGACTAMTLQLYAERKEWPLEGVLVRVLHARDGPDGTDRFAREIVLDGPLDSEQRGRLLEIANRCPVHRTLERGSDVITTLARRPLLDRPGRRADDHLRDMEEACAS
jgi:putative redox protein